MKGLSYSQLLAKRLKRLQDAGFEDEVVGISIDLDEIEEKVEVEVDENKSSED